MYAKVLNQGRPHALSDLCISRRQQLGSQPGSRFTRSICRRQLRIGILPLHVYYNSGHDADCIGAILSLDSVHRTAILHSPGLGPNKWLKTDPKHAANVSAFGRTSPEAFLETQRRGGWKRLLPQRCQNMLQVTQLQRQRLVIKLPSMPSQSASRRAARGSEIQIDTRLPQDGRFQSL